MRQQSRKSRSCPSLGHISQSQGWIVAEQGNLVQLAPLLFSAQPFLACGKASTAILGGEQLDLMQQKIIRLRAQMQELQVLTAECGAKGASVAVSPTLSCSSRDDDASEGLGCPVGSFSRQTTAEGDDDSLAPVPFSRQTSSDEDCDAWEDVVASTGAAEPCEFVVRHTFWSLEPLRTEGQHRRSKSAPAALRTRVGQVA